jgi:hypothetical protein
MSDLDIMSWPLNRFHTAEGLWWPLWRGQGCGDTPCAGGTVIRRLKWLHLIGILVFRLLYCIRV